MTPYGLTKTSWCQYPYSYPINKEKSCKNKNISKDKLIYDLNWH